MRKYYLDNLRYGIVLLVIFYHIVYLFNSLGVITNVVIPGIPQMDVFLYLIYRKRLISGCILKMRS